MNRSFRVSDLPDEPTVSVVIPSYNHAKYVSKAVESVLGQTYPHVELIVVDDGSADDSWEVLQELHVRSACARPFKIFRKENEGICATLNFGVRHSSGQLLCVLASDDWFRDDKIERQVAFFRSCPEDTGLIHSAAYKVYPDGDIIETHGQYRPAQGQCLKDLIAVNVQVIACSIMFPRAVWDEVGGFDETLETEDVAFCAAIAAHGYDFRYDAELLLYKRETVAGLGADTRACSDSHFRILDRYRSSFSAGEFRKVTSELQEGEGSLWSARLHFDRAWRCYLAAARTRRSPVPVLAFFMRAVRDIIRHVAPVEAKALLRRLRARAAKAS
jgi:glycosyltransferase involved in cell wall biosynthesis